MALKVGDTVLLKSGGPAMTIVAVLKPADPIQSYRTSWFSGESEQNAVFPEAALELIDVGAGPNV